MPQAAAVSPVDAPRAAPSAAQRVLLRLGLRRPIDLALHLPLRLEDETRLTPMADLRPGEDAQVEGEVLRCEERPNRQLVVHLRDASGTCSARFFHAHGGLKGQLRPGSLVRLQGQARSGLDGPTLLHPSLKSAQTPLPTTLTPVYPSAAGLPQAYLRKAVGSALRAPHPSDTLAPSHIEEIGHLCTSSLREALLFLHQPPAPTVLDHWADPAHPARQRLAAEELLAQQLAQSHARQQRASQRAPVLQGLPQADGLARLRATLPLTLTQAQARVSAEIIADLQRSQPMHRLLQGDVGAGKTVVAALAAAQCLDAGWSCALMAPTSLLAAQHIGKLVQWLAPLGVQVVWLTGTQSAAQRRATLDQLQHDTPTLIVGTHALVQHKLALPRLGLVIIDEQHRFGVGQRVALRHKGSADGLEPHLLMMSATPIPRTLAMSYYADLDVSTLDELPPGRTPVRTSALPDSRRAEVLARLAERLRSGRQAYWVCPLVEESEALDLANATATHAALQAAMPDLRVGLLHARLPEADKSAVMQAFAAGELALLVATTVIEVGMDVPNASLMVIEHAERFGLSQLHQLRGRVGRGSTASACLLLYGSTPGTAMGATARARLRALVDTTDGFEIARRDLALRGPGEFLGARQSGVALLRFADPQRDTVLLDWARRCATRLWQHEPAVAQAHLERWLGSASDYLRA